MYVALPVSHNMISPAASATTSPGRLKRDYLSFAEVFSQSVANVAPSATPALIIPLVAASAGNGTWLSYLLATITMLFVAVHVNYFARHSASPGSLYAFIARGLGPAWGIIAGWSLIIAYVFTGSAVLAGAANYAAVLFASLFGNRAKIPFLICFVILTAAAAWAIACKDVKLSTRSMLLLEFTSIGIIVWLAFAFIFKSHGWDPVQFKLLGATAPGVRQGIVLAVFSYVGFESATALGEEARDPLRTIPRAVLWSVIAVGAVFVFMSYILVAAFEGQATRLGDSNAPLSSLAVLAGFPAFGYAIAVGAIISFFACALASINAAARVMFAMARHGVLHTSAAAAHKTHATPHVALTIATFIALAPTLALFALKHPPAEVFGWLGSLATFGFLLAYVLVCAAAPVFLKSQHALNPPKVLFTLCTLALLALPLVGSVYPPPNAPANYLPFVFLLLMAVGLVWFAFLRSSQPELLAEIEHELYK